MERNKMRILSLFLAVALLEGGQTSPTNISVSTSSAGQVYAPGDLIFAEEFNSLNPNIWKHEINMNGGGNNEFQIYDKDSANSYVRDSVLYIRPTLTADKYGEEFLRSGTLKLEGCTDDFGCATCCGRTARGDYIMNPVISARLRTKGGFSFKYGRVEARARIPLGDWMWPAIWLLPENSKYGQWPQSGEIDVMESRGNNACWAWQGGPHIGVERSGSTLHFGPQGYNGFQHANYERQAVPGKGYDQDFHLYQLEWTPNHIKFSMDNVEMGTVRPGAGGFFELGKFPGHVPNPWRGAENFKIAPFDQNFHFILNVAVGGNYFPENAYCSYRRPWYGGSDKNFLEFWNARGQWRPTWKGESSAMAVDYIRVYAI